MQRLSFKQFVTEDIDVKNIDDATKLMGSYLTKKVGTKFFRYPGLEKYKSGDDTGYGVRLYSKDAKHSVRFNWATKSVNIAALKSVDVFDSKGTKKTIEFDKKVSLVKSLPLVADLINGQLKGKDLWTAPDDVPLNESVIKARPNFLIESNSMNPSDIYDGVVDMLSDPKFSRFAVYQEYRSIGQKIFDYIAANAGDDVIIKKGNKFTFVGSKADLKKMRDDKDRILSKLGCVRATVRSSSNNETYDVNSSVKHIEDNVERLTYEKQLEDMENLIRMTISGASNALFVAGRGGCLSGDTEINVYPT